MSGRQKIEAAFSKQGTPEIPAVICYERIFIRDHWPQLTSYPWWYRQGPDLERQMQWRRQVIGRIGQDWFRLPRCLPIEDRQSLSIDVRPEGVFQIDQRTGQAEQLIEPRVGGWSPLEDLQSHRPKQLAQTPSEIDQLVHISADCSPEKVGRDGSDELAARLLEEFGANYFPIASACSPLWACYELWGFEGMMTMIAEKSDLVAYASDRYLQQSLSKVWQAAALGAGAIWIEECMTDMISPAAFASLNVPPLRKLVEAIRALGMKSIYYYCGNPAGKWNHILSVEADAISFEEGKKNFQIDIQEVVARVAGKCTVLGNLDAVAILQNGSEEQLRAEIARQIAAGRRNANRFIMSLGSPVTPDTPVERVRLYCDLVHQIGRLLS